MPLSSLTLLRLPNEPSRQAAYRQFRDDLSRARALAGHAAAGWEALRPQASRIVHPRPKPPVNWGRAAAK
jgi:hypothetical protein